MRFLPPEDQVILYKTGFSDDLLGRVKVGHQLSELVDKIEDPLVIAIDGLWGTGKSHFLKRWVGAHSEQNGGRALTIYFDAFAHDYLSDPLIALIGCFRERIPEKKGNDLAKVKAIAFKIAKPFTRIGLAVATAGASEIAGAVGDAAIAAAGAEADDVIKKFWEKEEGRSRLVSDFRAALEKLTLAGDGEEPIPLVIVVDELDRCRPDFALETLEVAKHFFSVPHVHFVFGVNLHALENSVKARYGAGIDARSYLQKFLSIGITLPDEVDDNQQVKAVSVYAQTVGRQMGVDEKILEELCDQIKIISANHTVTIREVGKILSSAALLPQAALNPRGAFGWKIVCCTLLIVRVLRPSEFLQFTKAQVSVKTLESLFGYTGDVLEPTLPNGNQNPNYNWKVAVLFAAWCYVCRHNTQQPERFKQILGDMPSAFSTFYSLHDINKIPIQIHREWLSNFNIVR